MVANINQSEMRCIQYKEYICTASLHCSRSIHGEQRAAVGEGEGDEGRERLPTRFLSPSPFFNPCRSSLLATNGMPAMQASVLQIENTSESDPCSYGATKTVTKKAKKKF